MLKTFFEKEMDEKGNVIDNSRYFTNMKIMAAGDRWYRDCTEHRICMDANDEGILGLQCMTELYILEPFYFNKADYVKMTDKYQI